MAVESGSTRGHRETPRRGEARATVPRIGRAVQNNAPVSVQRAGYWAYRRVYVPLLASGKRAYDCGGFEMYLDQAESSMMVDRRFRRYESDLSAMIADELGPGDCYVDIGSNKGYHALEAASIVGESGQVHAFEPNPDNFADLNENVELNGFTGVRTYERAVSDADGSAGFQLGEKSGQGCLSDRGDVRVDSTTFDSFLREEGVAPDDVDFVKIDVEGAEADVFAGMTSFLREAECPIVVEVHSGADIRRMSEILHEAGVEFDRLDSYWKITP